MTDRDAPFPYLHDGGLERIPPYRTETDDSRPLYFRSYHETLAAAVYVTDFPLRCFDAPCTDVRILPRTKLVPMYACSGIVTDQDIGRRGTLAAQRGIFIVGTFADRAWSLYLNAMLYLTI